MLQNTFLHIPGIGINAERKLWAAGITHWNQALDERYCASRVSSLKAVLLREYVLDSIAALKRRDSIFFSSLARKGHTWRAYPAFAQDCVYIDIETTGLFSTDKVTVVGAYSNRGYYSFVAKQNLHEFPKFIRKFRFVVTFNGAQFDLPFLQRAFSTVRFPLHLDLRWAGKKLGLIGGLKEIERTLGISRLKSIKSIDGFEAVRLWYRHLDGDKRALPLLLRYNEADVTNLRPIAERICRMLVDSSAAPLSAVQVRGAKA